MLPFKISPPYYLLRSVETCWKCKSGTPVFAFGASGCEALHEDYEDELPTQTPFLLTNIGSIPVAFVRIAIKNGANLESRWSKMAGAKYYMNICRCGAPLGDHFLFSEPGHAFYPLSEDEARDVHVRRTNGPTTSVEVECRFLDSNL